MFYNFEIWLFSIVVKNDIVFNDTIIQIIVTKVRCESEIAIFAWRVP